MGNIRDLFGQPKVVANVFSATVQIAGKNFKYQDAWDDPCLMTGSARGEEILELLAEHLGRTDRKIPHSRRGA